MPESTNVPNAPPMYNYGGGMPQGPNMQGPAGPVAAPGGVAAGGAPAPAGASGGGSPQTAGAALVGNSAI